MKKLAKNEIPSAAFELLRNSSGKLLLTFIIIFSLLLAFLPYAGIPNFF